MRDSKIETQKSLLFSETLLPTRKKYSTMYNHESILSEPLPAAAILKDVPGLFQNSTFHH